MLTRFLVIIECLIYFYQTNARSPILPTCTLNQRLATTSQQYFYGYNRYNSLSSQTLESIQKLANSKFAQNAQDFYSIPDINFHRKIRAAVKFQNRDKNRYSDIVPYDETRVILTNEDPQELPSFMGADYINANHITTQVDSSQKKVLKYIATQGTLESTITQFWQMVIQQKSSIILMLTQLFEGREKCFRYWPENLNEPVTYSLPGSGQTKLTVTLLSEEPTFSRDEKILWITRKIQVKLGKKKMTVTHINYLAWPDFGVPKNSQDFHVLLNHVMRLRQNLDQETGQNLPITVHCSAGVGRTGMFIMVETLVNKMKNSLILNPVKVLEEMRAYRPAMIQNEKQYHFAVKSVVEWYQNNFA